MSKFKGTQGKWRVVDSSDENYQIRSSDPELIVFDGGYDKYDAQLIAAAPELLEVAIKISDKLDNVPIEEMSYGTLNLRNELQGIIDKALGND